MDLQSENDHLRALLSQYERDTSRTKWLLKRLGDKVRHFPRDLSRRLRKSRMKRLQLAAGIPVTSSLLAAPLFHILEGRRDELIALRKSDPAGRLTELADAGLARGRVLVDGFASAGPSVVDRVDTYDYQGDPTLN